VRDDRKTSSARNLMSDYFNGGRICHINQTKQTLL